MKLSDHIIAKALLKLATETWVASAIQTAVDNLVAAAPGTLDTLNELANALGDDPNFATTVTTALAGKVPLNGTGATGTWAISISGNAATATSATTASSATQAGKLTTPRLIGGTSFDGTADITPANATLAASATKLATARNIGGTPFDGTADITPANATLAASATKLATPRLIGGTSFDGTADIAVALAATATKLATARNINGVAFDGTAPITINAVDATARVALAGDTMTGNLSISKVTPELTLNDTGTTDAPRIRWTRGGTPTAYMGVSSVASSLINGSALNDMNVRTEGGAIRFSVDAGTSAKMEVGTTRVAVGSTGTGTSTASVMELIGSANVLIVRNPNGASYGGMRFYNDVNSSVRAMEFDYTGSSYAGQVLTSGPSGEQGTVTTTGAYPLSLGTNNTARMTISGAGVTSFLSAVQLAAAGTGGGTKLVTDADSGKVLVAQGTLQLQSAITAGSFFFIVNFSGSTQTIQTQVASSLIYGGGTFTSKSLLNGLGCIIVCTGTNTFVAMPFGL